MKTPSEKATDLLRRRVAALDTHARAKKAADDAHAAAIAEADRVLDAALSGIAPSALDLLAEAFSLDERPPKAPRKSRVKAEEVVGG